MFLTNFYVMAVSFSGDMHLKNSNFKKLSPLGFELHQKCEMYSNFCSVKEGQQFLIYEDRTSLFIQKRDLLSIPNIFYPVMINSLKVKIN